MLFVLIHFYLLGQVVDYAIDTHSCVSLFYQVFKLLAVFALSSPYYRCKYLELCALGKLHYLINNLIYRLLFYLLAAHGTMRYSHSCIKQSEIVVYLCDGTDCGTGVLRCGLLVYRYCGRKSLYTVYIWLFHLTEKHPRIRGQALYISSLSVCINSIES